MARIPKRGRGGSAEHRPLTNFYPLVGSPGQYVANLTRIMSMIQSRGPNRSAAISWVAGEFGTSREFARKVLDLLRHLGMTETSRAGLGLTPDGTRFVKELDVERLAAKVIGTVSGMVEILSILADAGPAERSALFAQWRSQMDRPLPRNQFQHRIAWLRAFGLVDVVTRTLYATDAGLRLLAKIRMAKAADGAGQISVSHNELEDRLIVIGEFFEFQAAKRVSVNDVLPSYALKLSQGDRQLDCLWIRYVPFGGRVKFPIEVHVGGNLADTIDRLETVSDFVQKAILVTTEDQETQVAERLKVKRSRLLDKLVIITVDDVYKAAAAASVLSSFTAKIFSD